MKRELIINENKEVFDYKVTRSGDVSISIGGETFIFSNFGHAGDQQWLQAKGSLYSAWSFKDDLCIDGIDYKVFDSKLSKRIKGAAGEEGGMLSPMPGKILKVLVAVGDTVEKGDALIVMEAMKMEHTIKASESGKISSISCGEGSLVDGGIALCTLETGE